MKTLTISKEFEIDGIILEKGDVIQIREARDFDKNKDREWFRRFVGANKPPKTLEQAIDLSISKGEFYFEGRYSKGCRLKIDGKEIKPDRNMGPDFGEMFTIRFYDRKYLEVCHGSIVRTNDSLYSLYQRKGYIGDRWLVLRSSCSVDIDNIDDRPRTWLTISCRSDEGDRIEISGSTFSQVSGIGKLLDFYN